MPSGARGLRRRAGLVPARDFLHRLEQCVRSGASAAGRNLVDPGWHQRHRRDSDPAGESPGCARDRHCRQRRQVCRLPSRSAPTKPSTTRHRISRLWRASSRTGKGVDVILDMVARQLCVRARWNAWPKTAGSSSSRCRVASRPSSTLDWSCGAGWSSPVPRCDRGPVALQGQPSQRRCAKKCGRCWTQGRVKPVIHSVFEAARAAEAHALMETNQHIGKIVLSWA